MNKFLRSVVVVAVLLGLPLNAGAAYSGEVGPGFHAQLTDRPCTHKGILERVNENYHKHMKAGTVTVKPENVTISVCWTEVEGALFGVDEFGGFGEFDRRKLKKDLEI